MAETYFTRGRHVPVPDSPAWIDDEEYDGPDVDAYLVAFEEATKDVPCATCGEPPVAGHDPCIANLPGVTFACCGHGVLTSKKTTHCYVVFDDGLVLYDAAAHAAIRMLGGNPAPIPDVRRRPTNHGVRWNLGYEA